MTDALFLEPVDVWSFRDGRPFEAGEAFEARSVFPPFPWTVLGCLRTALLRKLCPDPERYAGRGPEATCPRCHTGPCAAESVVGKAGQEAPFSVGPPFLAQTVGDGHLEIFYPTPRDLVYEDGNGGAPRLLAPIEPVDRVIHSLDGLRPIAAVGGSRVKSWPRHWVNHGDLVKCLAGQPPGLTGQYSPKVLREPRIGVGIDPNTRSARRGQLYLRDVVRLGEGVDERVGLLVETSEPLDLDGEVARLGGDGRMVAIRRVPAPAPVPVPEFDWRVKVCLVSPTWFEGGWRPRWLDPTTREGTVPGTDVRVRLLAAAMGDPVAVGGWDLKEQRPRILKPLVGPGAVYFFELLGGDAAAMARSLHGQPLCDDHSMAKAGFGLAFLGRY